MRRRPNDEQGESVRLGRLTQENPIRNSEWAMSVLLAATLGCLVATSALLMLFQSFLLGLLFPLLAGVLVAGVHRLLRIATPPAPDPRHRRIQGSIVLGGLGAVLLAVVLTGGSIPVDVLLSAGGGMAALALLTVAADGLRLANKRKAATRALAEVEKARELSRDGDHKTAEEMMQEALLASELAYGSHHPQVASIVCDLARLMRDRGRTAAASAMYGRAVATYTALRLPGEELAATLDLYADHLRESGEIADALSLANRAISEGKRVGEGGALVLGRSHLTLSRIQAAHGDVEAAYKASQAAARYLQEAGGKSHHETLQAKGLMAHHCLILGRRAEADRILREVMAEKEKLGESNDAEFLNLLLDLVGVQSHDAPAAAKETLGRAVEIYRVSVGPAYPRQDELLELLPAYLTEGASPDLEAFFVALFQDEPSAARQLFERNEALAKAVDRSGWTPLQWAALFDKADLIRGLLSRGADPSFGGSTGYPALYVACRWGQRNAVTTLCREGADPEIEAVDGSRPLHAAVKSGDQLTIDHLLNKKVNLNATNRLGWTPLHEAAFAGEKKFMLQLIAEGVDIHLQAPTSGDSPLHASVRGGSCATAEALILNGANTEARNAAGLSPLQLAEQRGQRELVALLRGFSEPHDEEPVPPAPAVRTEATEEGSEAREEPKESEPV